MAVDLFRNLTTSLLVILSRLPGGGAPLSDPNGPLFNPLFDSLTYTTLLSLDNIACPMPPCPASCQFSIDMSLPSLLVEDISITLTCSFFHFPPPFRSILLIYPPLVDSRLKSGRCSLVLSPTPFSVILERRLGAHSLSSRLRPLTFSQPSFCC